MNSKFSFILFLAGILIGGLGICTKIPELIIVGTFLMFFILPWVWATLTESPVRKKTAKKHKA